MVTTIDVDVLELWTRTVARTTDHQPGDRVSHDFRLSEYTAWNKIKFFNINIQLKIAKTIFW